MSEGFAGRFGSLLAPLAVAAVFAGALVLALRQAGARARELRSLAAEKGWAYSRTDAGGIAQKLEELFPGQSFNLQNLMTAGPSGGRAVLFECGMSRKGRSSVSFWSGGLREASRPGGGGALVEIFPRVRLEEALEADKVPIADPEFSRLFIVASKDAAHARRVVDARLRSVLLAHARRSSWTPRRVNMAGGRVAVLAGPNHGAGIFPELLELLEALGAD